MRRSIDIIVALPSLVLLTPVFILLVIWIKCDSPGPAFFGQRRVGKNRCLFRMWKFRTMTGIHIPHDDTLAAKGSNSRTRAGRIISAVKADELLQLVNVLLGDMTLVGPRPMMPKLYVKRVRRHKTYARRITVKPGITGFAALKGREEALEGGYREQLVYDRYQIRHSGLWFDIRVVWLTFVLVLKALAPEADTRLTAAE